MINEIKQLLSLLSNFTQKYATNTQFLTKNITEKEQEADELIILYKQLDEKITSFKKSLSDKNKAVDVLVEIAVLYSYYVEYFESIKDLVTNIIQSNQEDQKNTHEIASDILYRKQYVTYDTKRDLYLLTYTSENIIINYNYKGIALLNNDLKNSRDIFLFQGISITHVYKHFFYPHLIALYCAENQCIIQLDLNNFYPKNIPLPFKQDDVFLSSIYFWMESTLIIATTHALFYELNMELKTIQPIAQHYIKNRFELLYEFTQSVLQNNNVYDIHSDDYTFIIKDTIKNTFSRIDMIANTITNTLYYNAEVHDIRYDNGFFMFIHENFIVIEHDKKIIATIHAAQGRRFLRASFLDSYTKIVVLSDSQANYHCALALYDLCL